MENLPKKGPFFREFGAQKPDHMGGTYPYPQHVMYPPPGGNVAFTERLSYLMVDSLAKEACRLSFTICLLISYYLEGTRVMSKHWKCFQKLNKQEVCKKLRVLEIG